MLIFGSVEHKPAAKHYEKRPQLSMIVYGADLRDRKFEVKLNFSVLWIAKGIDVYGSCDHPCHHHKKYSSITIDMPKESLSLLLDLWNFHILLI